MKRHPLVVTLRVLGTEVLALRAGREPDPTPAPVLVPERDVDTGAASLERAPARAVGFAPTVTNPDPADDRTPR